MRSVADLLRRALQTGDEGGRVQIGSNICPTTLALIW